MGKPMYGRALRSILAKWLLEGMRRKGWRQIRLARESGVSRDTIWRIIKKSTDASDDVLRKLSDALGSPLPEIAGLVVGDQTEGAGTALEAPSGLAETRTVEGPTHPLGRREADKVRGEIADFMQKHPNEHPPWSVVMDWVERLERRRPS